LPTPVSVPVIKTVRAISLGWIVLASVGKTDTCDKFNCFRVFPLAHKYCFSATCFFEAWKAPKVRKISALLRFYGVHDAIIPLEEGAFAIILLLQRKAGALAVETGEVLNEVVLRQIQVGSEASDLHIGEFYFTRPAAAGGAAITFVKNGHGQPKVLNF
jgi:hypothetical protein